MASQSEIRNLLSNFDESLVQKLKQHEKDFLHAYQLHMVKIEKELQLLKSKAAEQDNKLHQDTRIVQLDAQLNWFKQEFENQMKIKESNSAQITKLNLDIKSMTEDTRLMRNEVKASRRQNKLLAASLLKQQQNKEELEQVSTMMDFERSKMIKDSAVMPNPSLSPFLPLSSQLNNPPDLNDSKLIGQSSLFDSKLNNDLLPVS